ncbi:MAG: GTP cyclohydrolase FolE2 [Pseudomonadota bacterium]
MNSVAAGHSQMPDVARDADAATAGTLDWVGMSEIHQPLLIEVDGVPTRVVASVDVHVDLVDPHAKGIHMSRLYLALEQHLTAAPLSVPGLRELLEMMLGSHADISASAQIELRFDHCLKRSALLSEHEGWNNYPVTIKATLQGAKFALEVGVDVLYSSTCPCSAALARQLIQRAFDERFAEPADLTLGSVREWLGTQDGIVATPHSQRSVARVRTRLAEHAQDFGLDALIDDLEHALQTPVQTAVKREDEQEFALRNGQNPMFCEDAARIVQQRLEESSQVDDYWVRIEHKESLHAHDAVAVVTKGVVGGYQR